MAGSVRVVLKSVWDDSGIKEAQKAFDKIGQGVDKAFRAVGVATAAAGAAVGAFAKSAIDAASDLEESTNAVNVAFGSAAAGVLAIGKSSAESLGLARNEFNSAAVRFSAFAERVVGEGGNVAGFIGDITQRAADFASVFNIDVAEALQVFQSGLAGEAEPLKRFGINLLDSEVKAYALAAGIIEVGEQMDETQKVQARYGLLMQSTNKVAGDFANTSDGLANSQRILRAQFTDLQAEIGGALLPVVNDLFKAFADALLPKLEELGAFLKSPEGQKAIEDVANAIKNFFELIIDNIDTIADVTVKVAAFVVGLKLLKTAVELATTAQLLFNVAVKANPYVIAATALIALAGGMALVADYAGKAEQKANAQAASVGNLQEEVRRLKEAFEDGLIPQDKFQAKLEQLEQQIKDAGGSIEGTIGEMARFNAIKLDSVRAELRATAEEARRLFAATTFTGTGGTASWLNEMFGTGPSQPTGSTGGTGGGGGTTGPSITKQANDALKDAREQVREATKDYNRSVSEAEKSYRKSIEGANKAFAESAVAAAKARDEGLRNAAREHARNIANIQKDFAKRQADVIQTSINRLRDAYRSAVQVNVVDLFGTEQVGKSVDGLIESLRNKLTASRRLLSNSAALASAGFSQTFIEQVVSAGTESGNEIANAILTATPEAQRELQDLFMQMEDTSETGMDRLAKSIYDSAGLATRELQALYENNNKELQESLRQAERDYRSNQAAILKSFDSAMTQAVKTRNDAYAAAYDTLTEALDRAAQALNDRLDDIRKAFSDKITAIGADLDKYLKKLDTALARARGVVIETPAPITPPRFTPLPGRGGPITSQPFPAPTYNVTVNAGMGADGTRIGETIVNEIIKFERSSGRVFARA